MVKIIVCLKQVPDTNEIKIDPKTNTLIRTGVPSIINPDDMAALELALQLKDAIGAQVIALTMGPQQADYALREALAMGADEAILLNSRAFAGADTWATGLTLAEAIKHIGDYQLILCGRQAIDGDTAQVGPGIAEQLDLPQATYVKSIKYNGDSVEVERELENGVETLAVELPAVLTVLKEAAEARLPHVLGIFRAFDEQTITKWDENELGLVKENIGLQGSPTQVIKTFTPPPKSGLVMIEGASAAEKVGNLLGIMEEKHII